MGQDTPSRARATWTTARGNNYKSNRVFWPNMSLRVKGPIIVRMPVESRRRVPSGIPYHWHQWASLDTTYSYVSGVHIFNDKRYYMSQYLHPLADRRIRKIQGKWYRHFVPAPIPLMVTQRYDRVRIFFHSVHAHFTICSLCCLQRALHLQWIYNGYVFAVRWHLMVMCEVWFEYHEERNKEIGVHDDAYALHNGDG
jgi:hypothetical protein